MVVLETKPTRRDATENRTAIIAAARVVLNKDPDAPLESIAAEARLTRRAIYGHFPTRDDLVREVVSRGVARIAEAVAQLSHPDPLVRLALIGARLWREVADVRVMAKFAVRGPLMEQVGEALAPLRSLVLQSVIEGQAAASIRTDIGPITLARLIEGAAIAVLDEATRSPMTEAEGHRLVMLSVLSAAGIGWRESDELIDTTPALTPHQSSEA